PIATSTRRVSTATVRSYAFSDSGRDSYGTRQGCCLRSSSRFAPYRQPSARRCCAQRSCAFFASTSDRAIRSSPRVTPAVRTGSGLYSAVMVGARRTPPGRVGPCSTVRPCDGAVGGLGSRRRPRFAAAEALYRGSYARPEAIRGLTPEVSGGQGKGGQEAARKTGAVSLARQASDGHA